MAHGKNLPPRGVWRRVTKVKMMATLLKPRPYENQASVGAFSRAKTLQFIREKRERLGLGPAVLAHCWFNRIGPWRSSSPTLLKHDTVPFRQMVFKISSDGASTMSGDKPFH